MSTSTQSNAMNQVPAIPCLSEEDLLRYLCKQMKAEEVRAVEVHVDQCSLCRQLILYTAQSPMEWGGSSTTSAADIATSDDHSAAIDDTYDEADESLDNTHSLQPKSAAPRWFLPPQDPWLGSQLGGLTLRKRVGEGGMGVVYQAQHQQTGELRAVKILSSGVSVQSDQIKRFQREARTLARIRHKHIVKVLDFGLLQQRQGYYLTMEYLHGTTLRQALHSRGQLSLSTIGWIVEQLCDALGCIHEEGVVHRDLKPENIMLLDPFTLTIQVKLIDFGLVSVQGETQLTHSGHWMGSPVYISPEQASGQAHQVGPAADLYSLGVMLMELLTGQKPFVGRNAQAVVERHIWEVPPTLAELKPHLRWAPRLEALLWSALAKSPALRPQSADQFWKAFSEACEEQRALGPLLS